MKILLVCESSQGQTRFYHKSLLKALLYDPRNNSNRVVRQEICEFLRIANKKKRERERKPDLIPGPLLRAETALPVRLRALLVETNLTGRFHCKFDIGSIDPLPIDLSDSN